MKKRIVKQALIAALIGAVSVSALAGCSASGGQSGALDASFNYAEARVKEFNSQKSFRSAAFYDKVFSTANAAAMIVNDKTSQEDFEKTARYLFLDSIIVADEKGNIVAAYPEEKSAKALKDSDELKIFNRVSKGISVKLMSDPEPVEGSDEYSILAGVARIDAGGAVVVSLKTDGYAQITGEKLAESCGANIMIISDGTVVSSTLDKVEAGTAADSLGINKEDIKSGEFTITVDNSQYECKGETLGDFTLVCAAPK